MPGKEDFKETLRAKMVSLYSEVETARILAEDSGIHVERINMSQKLIVVWNDILEEAYKQGLTIKILENAYKSYPNDKFLGKLYEMISKQLVSATGTTNSCEDSIPVYPGIQEKSPQYATSKERLLNLMKFLPFALACITTMLSFLQSAAHLVVWDMNMTILGCGIVVLAFLWEVAIDRKWFLSKKRNLHAQTWWMIFRVVLLVGMIGIMGHQTLYRNSSYLPEGAKKAWESSLTSPAFEWIEKSYSSPEDDYGVKITCKYTDQGLWERIEVADPSSSQYRYCSVYGQELAHSTFTFTFHMNIIQGCGGMTWNGPAGGSNDNYVLTICQDGTIHLLYNTDGEPTLLKTGSLQESALTLQEHIAVLLVSDKEMKRIYVNDQLLLESTDNTHPTTSVFTLLVGTDKQSQGEVLYTHASLWVSPP